MDGVHRYTTRVSKQSGNEWAGPAIRPGGCGGGRGQGRAVQVEPMKPMLKAPGAKHLKLKYDKLLSFCFIFAFNLNMRRYTTAVVFLADAGFTNGAELVIDGRDQGLPLLHFSPQPTPFLSPKHHTAITQCIPQKALTSTSSREVDECKPMVCTLMDGGVTRKMVYPADAEDSPAVGASMPGGTALVGRSRLTPG